MTPRHLNNINPSTGDAFAPIECADEVEVASAVSAAREAFVLWSRFSIEQRAEHMRRVADALEARAPEIGRTITAEMGRVLAESIPEVTKSASFLRYFADHASRILAPQPVDLEGVTLPEKRAWIEYSPRGVVGVIKPWNAPVQQLIWAVAPALMAGCTVVAKPSEYTPLSTLAMADAFTAAGLPDGVFSVLVGDDRTGKLLVESHVDVVAFTGSVESGSAVAASAGRGLKKTVLELSGKDALIVDREMPDRDLVVSGIVYGAFSNCGHWCSSIEHAYVPRELFDGLADDIVGATRSLRVGADGGVGDVGPIANLRQLAIVEDLVGDALTLGAKCLTGGERLSGPGNFYAPTILVDVPTRARLSTENVFGPVLALYPYDDLPEAVRRANATRYGLGLSFWTSNEETARSVVGMSETGMVWVNEPLQSLAPLPWSVCKSSGFGAELGASGMREFVYEKVVNAQFDNNLGPRPWYFPYSN